MSYTVYHKMTITPTDLKKTGFRLAETRKSDFCETPTEMLGII